MKGFYLARADRCEALALMFPDAEIVWIHKALAAEYRRMANDPIFCRQTAAHRHHEQLMPAQSD